MADFPSYSITGTRPAREMELAPDWRSVTDDYEFEDGRKDFNEVAATAPVRWEYEVICNGATAAQARSAASVYHDFFNTYRHSQPFDFTDKFGTTWSDVRIEEYERRHDAHKSWVVFVKFVLVSYTGVTVDPPEGPEDLTGMENPDEESITWTFTEPA